ncbi:hypothetical protein Dsin_016805 [Dipteronia sinensis]|uniref:Uncharacterized protein n=1 Tax=Dipteronia sinensis TaxID=43782 RepID=A0AAE0AE35_9ROSI|nr:hypothetical protein Dsin_016805 [Dipteronia sinensis]
MDLGFFFDNGLVQRFRRLVRQMVDLRRRRRFWWLVRQWSSPGNTSPPSFSTSGDLMKDQIRSTQFWVFSLGSMGFTPRPVIDLGSTPPQTSDLTRVGQFSHQTCAIRGDDHDRRLSSTIWSRSTVCGS